VNRSCVSVAAIGSSHSGIVSVITPNRTHGGHAF
jgi:hypothetical protein